MDLGIKNKMQNLLGEEFSEEEIEALLREDPELAQKSGDLLALFQKARSEELPPLSLSFTARVMEEIERPSFWRRFAESLFSFRGLMTAGACAASFLVGILVAPQFFGKRPPEPMSVREGVNTEGETVYYVRFTAKKPGALNVAVAGDFNQWNPVPLSRVNAQEGLFSAELPLKPGTYGYSFVVDDKTWVADERAERVVDDGFGNKNSVINL